MTFVVGAAVDRYIIETFLGRGGTAEVWKVRHQLLGTHHALKILTRISADRRQRMLTEARAQAQLRHPNILPVRDTFLVNGRPALLMPLVEGPSLADLLARRRLQTADAVILFQGILDGLAFAHQHDFVHRDLKPANILLDPVRGDVCPRIADFGLVKTTREATQTEHGVIFGTPAYAAPEQLQDASTVDRRADLFSLGVVFYEMLVGVRPFPGSSITAMRGARAPTPPLDAAPLPLQPVLAGLLAFEPAARWASCGAVQAALHQAWPASPLHRSELRADLLSQPFAPSPQTETLDDDAAPTFALEPAVAHNLPPTPDAFIGRQDAIETIHRRIDQGARLLTLVGFGGMGKTRLAVEAARTVLDRWPGGVWFIDLTDARTLDDVHAAVARVLDITLGPTPTQRLHNTLRVRPPTLFIVDNFEHILSLATQTIGSWLDAAADLTILVTSRAPTRLQGEALFSVEPLDRDAARSLFLERSGQTAPEHQEIIEAVIARLDGMPLAIEMAAARAQAAPLEQLEATLRLASTDDSRPRRQRTLRSTLRWSWALLNPEERAVLAQCSAFEGGFTFEAAEAILDLPNADGYWIEDILAELIDKSLLQLSTDERFSMLLTIQDFAREQLTDVDALHRRHADFYAHCTRAEERDNVRAAGRRMMAGPDLALSVQLANALSTILRQTGPYPPGVDMLSALLEAPGLNAAQRCQLWLDRAMFFVLLNRFADAQADLHNTLALARARSDQPTEARALHNLGGICIQRGHFDEGVAYNHQAIAIAEASGRRRTLCLSYYSLGTVARQTGDLKTAEQHLRKALSLSDNKENRAIVQSSLGALLIDAGRGPEGAACYARAISDYRATGNRLGEANTRNNLGLYHSSEGRYQKAHDLLMRALRHYQELGNLLWVGLTLGDLGLICTDLKDFPRAEAYFHRAVAVHQKTENRRGEAIAWGNLGNLFVEQGRFPEAMPALQEAISICVAISMKAAEGAFRGSLGLALAATDHSTEALEQLNASVSLLKESGYQQERLKALCRRADLYRSRGQLTQARSDLKQAQTIADAIQLPDHAPIAQQLSQTRAAIAAQPSTAASTKP